MDKAYNQKTEVARMQFPQRQGKYVLHTHVSK